MGPLDPWRGMSWGKAHKCIFPRPCHCHAAQEQNALSPSHLPRGQQKLVRLLCLQSPVNTKPGLGNAISNTGQTHAHRDRFPPTEVSAASTPRRRPQLPLPSQNQACVPWSFWEPPTLRFNR